MRILMSLICCSILLSQAIRADDSVNRLVSEINLAKKKAEEQKNALTEEIKAMESGRINKQLDSPYEVQKIRNKTVFLWQSKEAKATAIGNKKQKLASLSDINQFIPQLRRSMKVGDIGRFPTMSGDITQNTGYAYQYEVLQVVDANNMLVNWTTFSLALKSYQRLGDKVSAEDSFSFWLIGPTAGFADGSKVSLTDAYKVIGTEQYATAIGSSKTVFKLEKFDTTEVIKNVQK